MGDRQKTKEERCQEILKVSKKYNVSKEVLHRWTTIVFLILSYTSVWVCDEHVIICEVSNY